MYLLHHRWILHPLRVTWQAQDNLGLQSLGWEDPLEEDMATHSSRLAWRISWIEAGGPQSTKLQKPDTI